MIAPVLRMSHAPVFGRDRRQIHIGRQWANCNNNISSRVTGRRRQYRLCQLCALRSMNPWTVRRQSADCKRQESHELVLHAQCIYILAAQSRERYSWLRARDENKKNDQNNNKTVSVMHVRLHYMCRKSVLPETSTALLWAGWLKKAWLISRFA